MPAVIDFAEAGARLKARRDAEDAAMPMVGCGAEPSEWIDLSAAELLASLAEQAREIPGSPTIEQIDIVDDCDPPHLLAHLADGSGVAAPFPAERLREVRFLVGTIR